MKLKSMFLAVAGSLSLATLAHAAVVTVNATDDLYSVSGQGTPAEAINVTGLQSITFSVSTGRTVTVNNGNYNDADGVGSVSGEYNSGANGISGITSPTAGYIAGAFVSGTLGATPAALDFTGTGATSFTSLSPLLQQAFFIGDGLTGDGTGTTQTFYVPTGATTLYLGLTDACGYNGSPSCYGDNYGSFVVTSAGTAIASGVPEPSTWALMLVGMGAIGFAMRRRATVSVSHA